MPIIGTLTHVGLSYANKFPHYLNYPVKITEVNARVQYQNILQMLRMLKVQTVITFFYITYRTIRSALSQSEGLGSYFLTTSMVVIFGTLGFYIFRSLSLSSKTKSI